MSNDYSLVALRPTHYKDGKRDPKATEYSVIDLRPFKRLYLWLKTNRPSMFERITKDDLYFLLLTLRENNFEWLDEYEKHTLLKLIEHIDKVLDDEMACRIDVW